MPMSQSQVTSSRTAVGRRATHWTEVLDRLRSFVASRVEDPELAADITQDVVVRSIASGALDRVDDPTAWLYRSARNAVIDHYRTRRIHAPVAVLDGWPDPDTSGDLPNAATRELAHCLQPLLNDLPPTARDALTRVDLDGQTHQQAADQLGISVSGMKSRVQRARRQLRDLLTGCCQVDLDRAGAVSDYRPAGNGDDGCACSVTE
jgi:RNA polymerase sigma-70 factor (ECF subfamily)